MIEIDYLRQWIGRTEERDDLVGLSAVRGLTALLDRDEAPPRIHDALPPLGHWLLFLPSARQSDIDRDGHAKRGGFLPPVPLPRRMFAGARVQFHKALHLGDSVRQVSEIAAVSHKEGRSGSLVFVVLRHRVYGPDGLSVTEDQDIVYRDEAPKASGRDGAVAPPRGADIPPPGEWQRTINPDPVMLFRFSALTFNGHRIHYDRTYAMEEEGYPGLVVHGPLLATLLMDLCRRQRPGDPAETFSFRALQPVFDTALFTIDGAPSADGRGARLYARNPSGSVAMQADVQFSAPPS